MHPMNVLAAQDQSPVPAAESAEPIRLQPSAAPHRVQVEIVVPVHNEQRDLERSVQRLHGYLVEQFPFRAVVTIADNGSTDRTCAIAASPAARLPRVRLLLIEQPSRGARPPRCGPALRPRSSPT